MMHALLLAERPWQLLEAGSEGNAARWSSGGAEEVGRGRLVKLQCARRQPGSELWEVTGDGWPWCAIPGVAVVLHGWAATASKTGGRMEELGVDLWSRGEGCSLRLT